MKRMPFVFVATLILLAGLAVSDAFLQTTPKVSGDWMRIQSDDGEFSIEVPLTYKFFYDKDGFSIGGSIHEFSLRNMEMLNAYVDGTLLSFERYAADRDAAAVMFESDSKSKGVIATTGEERPNGLKYRQIVSKTDHLYSIRQYFYSKEHIYVLTAASRGEETTPMRRFLDSVNVEMKPPTTVSADAVVFSKLNYSTPAVEDETGKPKSKVPIGNVSPSQKSGPDDKPFAIVFKPIASYTGPARAGHTTGTITVRIDFGADGSVQKAVFVQTLPNGLSRQALFAGLRIKFLPAQTNGVTRSSTKLVEYTFSIY